ncbi:MAG: CPBP family intramembrane metalloprotease [Vicinamibacterales bacterium]
MDAPAPETDEPGSSRPVAEPAPAPTASERITALLEIVLCSGYPTQLAIARTLATAGVRPEGTNGFSLAYVAGLSLIDTAVLIGLMVFFLRARGENPRSVFLGTRPIGGEIRAGIPLVLLAFVVAVAMMLAIQTVLPQLHNVPRNPFQDAVKTRVDVAILLVLVVVAGGLREELQRAFLLGRFERWLGGARVGLVVTSLGFGLGHYYEGYDAMLVTAALGAFWASVYLARRSVAAPVVSHAGFNLLQVAQFLAITR